MNGTATYVEEMSGSYNVVLKFQVTRPDTTDTNTDTNTDTTSEQHVALRVQMPSFCPPALASELLANEVACLQFFAARGIAKVPAVFAWDATASDPIVGCPYILMAFVAGESLVTCLIRWRTSEDPQDKVRLHAAYEDIAAMLLAMYRQPFDKIGALRPSADGGWAVTQRPVTQAMRDLLVTVPGTTADAWPDGPLATAADYKALYLQLNRSLLDNLRSINIHGNWVLRPDRFTIDLASGKSIQMNRVHDKAAGRIIAHHGYARPDYAPHLNAEDTGPFRLFNSAIHPRNMLVDAETGRITAVFDLECTNAMPAAFAEDPPLFLFATSIFVHTIFYQLDAWQEEYTPALETFWGILERLEAQQPPEDSAQEAPQTPQTPLSARMRASWASKQWLLHLAMDDMNVSDFLFWSHHKNNMKPLQEDALEPEIEAYIQHTEKQVAAYEAERKVRWNEWLKAQCAERVARRRAAAETSEAADSTG